jgi:hypothetical protein
MRKKGPLRHQKQKEHSEIRETKGANEKQQEKQKKPIRTKENNQ